jgi:hypothetical protein
MAAPNMNAEKCIVSYCTGKIVCVMKGMQEGGRPESVLGGWNRTRPGTEVVINMRVESDPRVANPARGGPLARPF